MVTGAEHRIDVDLEGGEEGVNGATECGRYISVEGTPYLRPRRTIQRVKESAVSGGCGTGVGAACMAGSAPRGAWGEHGAQCTFVDWSR